MPPLGGVGVRWLRAVVPIGVALIVGFAVLRASSTDDRSKASGLTDISAGFSCTIVGTDGNDVLLGTSGSDVICGQGGNDVLRGGAGDDTLVGGAGKDTASFAASPKPVSVRLGRGAVGEGADVIQGVENAVGSPGDDVLSGTPGANRLSGGAGNDILRGDAGEDVLLGGPGNDRLRGGAGQDTLVDAAGKDRLFGGVGRDELRIRDRRPYDLAAGGADVDLCIADAGDWRSGCGHPIVVSHDRRVPVLMYHVIAVPGPGTPNLDLWVSPTTFAAQMRWVARHGYHVVTLQEVYDYWHGGPLPRKPIVVSFDDGFHGHYTKALPILAKHGWAGTLNLALSHYPGELNRVQIRALLAADWELDSHSLTHVSLPGLSAASLHAEVSDSRRVLRRRFHVPVNFFCYPSGAFDSTVVAAVRAAGYLGATTTEYGLARRDEAYTLDRVRVSHDDGVDGLARKLG